MKVLSTVFVCSVFTGLLLAPLSSSAATKKNTGNTKTVAQVQKALTQLLKASRKTVSSYNTELLALEFRAGEIYQKEDAQQQLVFRANNAHNENDQELRRALNENYRTETTAVIVPRVTELHQGYLSFVDRYRRQAGIVPNHPSYIQGDYESLRRAMAEIVASQNNDLLRIKEIVKRRVAFVDAVQNELSIIRNNQTSDLIRFGFDHYLNLLLQRFDGQREIAQTSTMIINAKDYLNQTRRPVLRCIESNLFYPFTEILGDVVYYAKQSSTNSDFTTSTRDNVIKHWYDENTQRQTYGYISHWSGCVTNRRNNAENFRRDVQREAARGNIELARRLDQERANLEYQAAVTEEELNTLIHHKAQVESILRATTFHKDVPSTPAQPAPWYTTTAAHTDNLIVGANFYPPIMRATDDLLKRALDEIRTLGTITDVTARNAEISLVNEKLTAIREAGFARLVEQLDSVNDQLNVMSYAISGGGAWLSDTLTSYAIATQTKAAYWKSEQENLPNVLKTSAAAAALARDTYTKSLALVKTATSDFERYQQLRERFFLNTSLIRNKFGNSRFNPIYSELADNLLSGIGNNKDFIRSKKSIEQMTKDQLAAFNGIIETRPKRLNMVRASNKKSTRRANASLGKQLAQMNQEIKRNLHSKIDSLSSPYLNNKPISQVLAEAKNDLAQMMAIPT